ncbi:MAG TPA: N-formylglutamate amidohydrolase [Steroidobacteraceae bacterium]|nr:N-formylglutamate amidohydrolase [Steroidobacteraceae bacterium]
MRSVAESSASHSHHPLIAAGDPPPYSEFNPTGRAPFLLVCDHASNVFPAGMARLGLTDEATRRHIAWDIGAGDLTRALARLFDAPALLAGYSRLVIDCNRALTDPSSILAASDGEVIPGNRRLTSIERELRARSFFEPYHVAIALKLDELRRRRAGPALISVHSFTPVLGSEQRPWHAGVLWDRDPRIAVPLLERLRQVEGLEVGDNLPYSGRHPADYTIARHAESARLPHVCLEIRQDELESAAGVERWARILVEALGPILAEPALHRGGSVGV